MTHNLNTGKINAVSLFYVGSNLFEHLDCFQKWHYSNDAPAA